MGRITSILTAACVATTLTAGAAAAQGTLADRKTNVTFSGPVSVPGTTLPAGTYVFKIADSPANRHIVQIFDKDESKIIATLLAVPAMRDEADGDPVVSFKETPSNRPPAVRYWYYAGEKDGNEFVYPRAQAMQIAQASGESVSSFDTDATDMDSWKKGSVTKVSSTDSAQSTTTGSTTSTASTTTASTTSTATTTATPAPAPVTSQSATTAATTSQTTTAPAAPTPTEPTTTQPTTAPAATAPATTPEQPSTPTTAPSTAPDKTDRPVGTSGRARTLPRTASELPLIGLFGFLALAGAFGVRAIRRATV